MKTAALALVVLLVGANALPYELQNANPKNGKVLDGIIRDIIDSIIEQIRERDLDPIVVDYAGGVYEYSDIFSVEGFIQNFAFTGLSNINVNDVSVAGGVLNVDLEFPQLEATIGASAADVRIFSRNINAEVNGRLAIKGLRVAFVLKLDFSGYLLDDLQLGFQLGGIESELNVKTSGRDISNQVNDFLGNRLPTVLIDNEELINKIVADIIRFVIDRLTVVGARKLI